MDGSKDGQAGVPVMVAVAQGPAAPTAASKRLAALVAGLVGVLAPAVRKRRPARGWPATVPMGALMAVATAKEPAAPTTGPTGVLAPATTKGGSVGGWGCVAVPMAAPATATIPTIH
jgi:hypothetical protein